MEPIWVDGPDLDVTQRVAIYGWWRGHCANLIPALPPSEYMAVRSWRLQGYVDADLWTTWTVVSHKPFPEGRAAVVAALLLGRPIYDN
jgi:hypothetical protein